MTLVMKSGAFVLLLQDGMGDSEGERDSSFLLIDVAAEEKNFLGFQEGRQALSKASAS